MNLAAFTLGVLVGAALMLLRFWLAFRFPRKHHHRHNAVSGSIHFGSPLSEGDEEMSGAAIGVIKSVGATITGTPNFTDAQGNTVAASSLNPQWASADPTKVTVGPADPSTGASVITGVATTGVNPDGSPATVAVTCTGTNADGTTDVLTGAVQVADDAVGGSIAFA